MKATRALLIVVGALAAACSSDASAPSGPGPGLPPAPPPPAAGSAVAPAPVPAGPAASGGTTFVGVVTTRSSKVVAAEFEARIDALLVRAGQTVKTGDSIARLDATLLARQVEAARAAEAAARAESGRAGVEVGEAKRLHKLEGNLLAGNAGTREAVRTAKANVSRAGALYGQASASYRAARAERERLEELLARGTLAAPIDGVVSLIRVKEGELALPGTPIARIFDPSDRQIRFAVPPELRAELPPGTAVSVIVPGAPRALVARVSSVTSVLEPPLQLAIVDADLDDSHPDTALAEVGAVIDVRRMP